MKWYSTHKHSDDWHFIIQADTAHGFYLFVYEFPEAFEEDFNATRECISHQQDHTQDTFQYAKEQAFEDFGVPLDTWRLIE